MKIYNTAPSDEIIRATQFGGVYFDLEKPA